MSAFHDATINSLINSNQAVILFHQIETIRHHIDSMYRRMRIFLRHRQSLEPSTILHITDWFVSPGSHSVDHLLNQLHLAVAGRINGYRSGLKLLVNYYAVSILYKLIYFKYSRFNILNSILLNLTTVLYFSSNTSRLHNIILSC